LFDLREHVGELAGERGKIARRLTLVDLEREDSAQSYQ